MEKETEYNQKSNISKWFFIIAIVISIITSLIILLEEKRIEYKYISSIPISYTFILIIFSKIFLRPFYKYGLTFFVAQFFIFIRYALTPLSMVLVEDEFLTGPNPSLYDINISIILMIYELICIFIAIYFVMSRLKTKEVRERSSSDNKIFKNKFIVTISILLLGLILVNYPNALMPDQLLFVDEEFDNIEIDSSVAGAISISSMLFKCIVFLFLLSVIKKYSRNNLLSLIFTVLVLVLFMASFTGTSRWTLIFMSVTGLIITGRLFPKYKRFLTVSIMLVLIPSIISISMSNFYWVIQNTETPVRDIIQHMSKQFQVYFSGPRPVAQSIKLGEYFPNISVSTFLNDFLGSVPFISNYIDGSNRINFIYNLYNYRTTPTLIMPLVGIGYTYFGFILAPIFTVLAQMLIVKIDNVSRRENNLEFVFVYTYLGFRLSMSMGLSTQSLFSSLLIPTIPLLVIFILNKKIVLKKNKVYRNSRNNYITQQQKMVEG